MSEDAQATGDTISFPAIVGLDLGVNAPEDRVVMIARTHSAGQHVILLTRRMMGQLLSHYAALLKRTSPAAARAPSAQQDEVLQMEHVSALLSTSASASGTPEGVGTEPSPPPPESVYLVTEIRMQMTDSHVMIGFIGQRRHAAGIDESKLVPIAAATMDRAEAHRFLAMLNDKAHEAGWGLEGLCPWLTSDGLGPSAQRQVN